MTHPGNVDHARFFSAWDLQSAPTDNPKHPIEIDPVQWPTLQEPDTRYEGVDFENGHVWVAIHEQGVGIYRRDDTYQALNRVGTIEGITDAYDIAVHGDLAYVVDMLEGLVIFDVSDLAAPRLLGRAAVGGQATDLKIVDGVAYIAAGSAGLVTVDVSDPAAPVVLSTTEIHGTVVRVHVADQRAYLAAWNDMRVFDVSDPASPVFIGAARITENADYPDDGGLRPEVMVRTFGVTSFGDYVFIGNWNNPYSYQIHPENQAPYLVVPEEVNYLGFGRVALGETEAKTLTVRNDGTAPLTVFHVATDHPAFTVAPDHVRLAPGASADLTVSYAPTSRKQETAFLEIWSDDPQQPVRTGYLVGNSPALDVGDTFPELVLDLVNTDAEWTYEPGAPTLLVYFATF